MSYSVMSEENGSTSCTTTDSKLFKQSLKHAKAYHAISIDADYEN